jgi:hypothetical protein
MLVAMDGLIGGLEHLRSDLRGALATERPVARELALAHAATHVDELLAGLRQDGPAAPAPVVSSTAGTPAWLVALGTNPDCPVCLARAAVAAERERRRWRWRARRWLAERLLDGVPPGA